MASVLIRCPVCKRFQATSNKKCKGCEAKGIKPITRLDHLKKNSPYRVKYYVQYRINGTQKYSEAFDRLELAQAFASDMNGKKVTSKAQLGAIDNEGKMTVRELAQKYIEVKGCKSTKTKVERAIKLLGIHADKTLGNVVAADFEILEAELNKAGYKLNTIRDTMVALKTLMNWGATNCMVSGNTMIGI